MSAQQPRTLKELLSLHERLIIIKTLAACGFSRTRSAKVLGISRVGLWKRMKKLGIGAEAAPRTTPGRPKKIT